MRKGPSASKYKVKIGCKDMEGRVKGPSTERIKVVYISFTHIFLWLIIVLPDFMEGTGKGSECIKTLRMRGSVPVHRN